jgi:hypothetical protein
MRYHVETAMGGGLKNPEMDVYCEVLRDLGHSDEREQERVPQPNGTVYLKGRNIGAVGTKAEAEAIKAELAKRLPHLPWVTVQVP